MSNKQEFYGWKLVAVLFSLDFLNMGFPFYGGTVMNSYMLHQIPMSRSTLGLGFTLINLFVGLPSTLVALSIIKRGINVTFAIGSALIVSGSLWLAFLTTKPWQYLVGFGVINGIGISFATLVPATTAVTRWFKRYRGRAMGIVLGASGFSGFFISPLLNRLLAATGGNWRLGWEIVACFAVVAGLIGYFLVKERPEDLGQVVDGVANEEQVIQQVHPGRLKLITNYGWTPAEAYRTRSYWLLAIGGIACQFPFFFFTAHWILYQRGVGVSAAAAAFAMGLFTMGGIVGRWIGGWLMDVMTARYAFMSGFICYFLGSFLALRISPDTPMIGYVAAVLYGAGFGWTFICLNTCTAHYYGPAAFPKLNGMMLLLTSSLASPAGVIGGRIFDIYGSYDRAFELNVIIAAIGVLAMAFATLPRPRPVIAATATASPQPA